MKVQGRRKRAEPNRRWLKRVRDDMKEKQLSADEVHGCAIHAGPLCVCHRPPTPHESGNKRRKKKFSGSLCFFRFLSSCSLTVDLDLRLLSPAVDAVDPGSVLSRCLSCVTLCTHGSSSWRTLMKSA